MNLNKKKYRGQKKYIKLGYMLAKSTEYIHYIIYFIEKLF